MMLHLPSKMLLLAASLLLSLSSVSFVTAQSNTARVIAEAFLCNEQLEQVNFVSPRQIGQMLQICIQPNMPTQLRDVRMRSIEEFGFLMENTDITQFVIKDGRSTNEELTIYICAPGSLACTIKTKLLPAFHEALAEGTVGEVIGGGTATFVQTDGGNARQRRLRGLVKWRSPQSSSENENERSLRIQDNVGDAFQDYAGDHTFRFTIPILAGKDDSTAPGTVTIEKSNTDEIKNWWHSLPKWAQILIPVAAGVIVLGCIVVALLCLCSCNRSTREKGTSSEVTDRDDSEVYAGALVPMRHVSIQPQQQEQEGPTEEDVCFNSGGKWPGTTAFFRAVRTTASEFDEWSLNVPTHVKQQLLNRKFYKWEFDEALSEGGYWRPMTNTQVNQRIKKEFNRMKKSTSQRVLETGEVVKQESVKSSKQNKRSSRQVASQNDQQTGESVKPESVRSSKSIRSSKTTKKKRSSRKVVSQKVLDNDEVISQKSPRSPKKKKLKQGSKKRFEADLELM